MTHKITLKMTTESRSAEKFFGRDDEISQQCENFYGIHKAHGWGECTEKYLDSSGQTEILYFDSAGRWDSYIEGLKEIIGGEPDDISDFKIVSVDREDV